MISDGKEIRSSVSQIRAGSINVLSSTQQRKAPEVGRRNEESRARTRWEHVLCPTQLALPSLEKGVSVIMSMMSELNDGHRPAERNA